MFFNSIEESELDMPSHDQYSSECALILNGNKMYSNDYSHFSHGHEDRKRSLLDEDDDDDMPETHLRMHEDRKEICITYGDVDRAVYEAKRKLGNFVPNEIFELSSNLPKSIHVAVPAEIIQEASRLLANWFHLPRELILFALPKINTLKTSVKDICPTFLLPVKCEISKYRTLTGMCNNLKVPSWGSARSAYIRYLPPDYGDGISESRLAKDGSPLPSSRLVSFVLHNDLGESSIRTTLLIVAWSQMIGHDFSLADVTTDEFGEALECCKNQEIPRHPACLPINIPKNDPFYKFFSQKCMNFARTFPALKPNCLLGPRGESNIVSSYIDANFVYGSDQETAKRLRAMKGGRLKTTPLYEELGLKDLLPMKTGNPDRGCERKGRPRDLFCFDAGDRRVNEQVPLAVLHTIFMREHNRIADQLAYHNSHWDDETLYQETRRIIIAQVQHITYNEFLPVVLGDKLMDKYGLTLQKKGYYKHYNPKINGGARIAFGGSAFRFGHSMVPDIAERYNKFHDKLESIRFSRLILQPFDMYKPGIMDTFILGLVNQESARMDPQISTEMTNHLFEKPGMHFGNDLAAIDIQRGREMGIPGYNFYREYCGLKKAYGFNDLVGYLDNRTIHRLSKLYKHVDDIDLWSAGIAEYPTDGSMLGPVFNCLIGEQFAIARNSDRFWYEGENPASKFTLEQLEELRKSTLAKLICDNSDDIDTVQLYPFLQADPLVNPRVDCHKLSGMDLSVFADNENSYSSKK